MSAPDRSSVRRSGVAPAAGGPGVAPESGASAGIAGIAGPDGDAGATVRTARARLVETLRRGGVAEPDGDARRLLAHALATEPSRLAFEGDRPLTPREVARLDRFAAQRLAGRTVARIVGHRAFHDIVLGVADGVLEPRDDTAALVELALPHVRAVAHRSGRARVLDVGTGTGAVALAILAAEPRAEALGTDVNPAALRLARENAGRLGLCDRFHAVRADALGGVGGAPYDAIASNPPYIPTAAIGGLAREARADPREALDGGPDGLAFYRTLARRGAAHLAPGGLLCVEIGAGQGCDVRRIMVAAGWREAGVAPDLGGHERALAFDRPPPAVSGDDSRG